MDDTQDVVETPKAEETTEEVVDETPAIDLSPVLAGLTEILDSVKALSNAFNEFVEREPAVAVANGETVTDDEVEPVIADEDEEVLKPIEELDLSI